MEPYIPKEAGALLDALKDAAKKHVTDPVRKNAPAAVAALLTTGGLAGYEYLHNKPKKDTGLSKAQEEAARDLPIAARNAEQDPDSYRKQLLLSIAESRKRLSAAKAKAPLKTSLMSAALLAPFAYSGSKQVIHGSKEMYKHLVNLAEKFGGKVR